ncbi:hypothetical protein [Clostridium sp. D33t1_170424_F3]|uniref:hypothetical protein n=1 Tax=Clostridium sp. D33t1_170424_F3 TaxID=2787099 RepID=UPI0018A96466|nr:hypothetical protein [Clostridium sp. D33t1_170424_F3]
MKLPDIKINLTGYGVMGVIVLVLLVLDIKDVNAPGIGLDVVLLGFIIYMIYKTVNKKPGKDNSGK